jgi:hypothetical protein
VVELQIAAFLTAPAVEPDERAASAVARDQLAPDGVRNVFAPPAPTFGFVPIDRLQCARF